jgi:ATP-dependent DNA helicase RecG
MSSYITWDTPLSEISGIRKGHLDRLRHLGITTAGELLRHLPTRYENFSELLPICNISAGIQVTVRAQVEKIDARHVWNKRGLTIIEAQLNDGTGTLKAIWFNQPYLKNILPPGSWANFSGKISVGKNEDIYLSNAVYERAAPGQDSFTHTAGLIGIYSETKGLTSRYLRALIKQLLENIEMPEEWLPDIVLREAKLPDLKSALHAIHFPQTEDEADDARRRFSFEDIFLLQTHNQMQRETTEKENAPKISANSLDSYINALPFTLTSTQAKTTATIAADLAHGYPMNRLVQGDVGSGKTVVAVLAALLTAKSGYQTAFMAPTEILARQHFATLSKIIVGIQEKNPTLSLPAIAVLTAAGGRVFYPDGLSHETNKKKLNESISRNEVQVVLGTHALIQKNVDFYKLGLVVVDEQHRFGVRQRQELAKHKGKNELIPHLLSMTATPIPRTLMLTVFGDLDISLITDLPAGRKPIVTKVVLPEDRIKAYGFIKGQIIKGRQAFVICPRIERKLNEDYKQLLAEDAKTVTEEYERLRKRIFPEFSVGMLHGKMPAKGGSASGGKATKESVMQDFRANKIQILVSTSVVEVGVDVPNATVMMIEGAERFGLAQLYQFRGRVGRGTHQSFCFLFAETPGRENSTRLQAIVRAKNGLELAEEDLKLRGPGEFLGDKQSGTGDALMSGLQNVRLVEEVQQYVKSVFDAGIAHYPLLKDKAAAYAAALHRE